MKSRFYLRSAIVAVLMLLSFATNRSQKHGFKLDESRFLKVRNIRIDSDSDLASEVLGRASFLNPKERQYTTPKLLAYSASKDKALIEIFVNRGPLGQEWWHVVVSRHGNVWKFFSVTQVAVS